MQALSGSDMSCMSDSWIAFQPAIEEPSNMIPSAKVSSSTVEMSTVTCCHLPRGSVKRKSTNFTSLSLTIFRTSLAVVIHFPFLETKTERRELGQEPRVQVGIVCAARTPAAESGHLLPCQHGNVVALARISHSLDAPWLDLCPTIAFS